MSIIRFQTPKLAAWPSFDRLPTLADLFDSAFPTAPSLQARYREWLPAVELLEDDNQVTVRLDAVGLNKEDFQISLHEQILTISAERNQANGGKADGAEAGTTSARKGESFSRSLTLPSAVEASEVRATYQDGVLTVQLPKTAAAKPRKIEISAK